MIEWAKSGREILAAKGKDLSREERTLLVAQVRAAELVGRALERARQKTQAVTDKTPQAAKAEAAPKIDPLTQVVAEYKKGPLTPDSVTNFWQGFIRTSIEQAGPAVVQEIDPESIVVPTLNRSTEELVALGKDRGMVYDPRISYPLLGKIFPSMANYAVGEKSPITDEYTDAGWSDVDIAIDVPNRNTTEDQLREAFGKDKRGLRLSTYIWASQASKVLTGEYLDQGDTWSRLLGSRYEGYVVYARFYPYGYLDVYWDLDPSAQPPYLGGRSEGVKA